MGVLNLLEQASVRFLKSNDSRSGRICARAARISVYTLLQNKTHRVVSLALTLPGLAEQGKAYCFVFEKVVRDGLELIPAGEAYEVLQQASMPG